MRFAATSALTLLFSLALASTVPVVETVDEPQALTAPATISESLSTRDLIAARDAQADRTNSLKAHNAARSAVKVGALTWDTGLQASAQAYANKLAKTPGGHLEHSRSGENLYWRSAYTDHDLLLGTQAWVNEKPNYHNEVIPQGNFAAYGHYTQVVWKNTKRVGVAAARDSKGGVYVVAHYDPVGNYVGQRPY